MNYPPASQDCQHKVADLDRSTNPKFPNAYRCFGCGRYWTREGDGQFKEADYARADPKVLAEVSTRGPTLTDVDDRPTLQGATSDG